MLKLPTSRSCHWTSHNIVKALANAHVSLHGQLVRRIQLDAASSTPAEVDPKEQPSDEHTPVSSTDTKVRANGRPKTRRQDLKARSDPVSIKIRYHNHTKDARQHVKPPLPGPIKIRFHASHLKFPIDVSRFPSSKLKSDVSFSSSRHTKIPSHVSAKGGRIEQQNEQERLRTRAFDLVSTSTSTESSNSDPSSKPSRPVLPPLVQFNLQGIDFHIDPILLRDSCKCSNCVDPSSKQRKFRTGDIPLDVSARAYNVEGDKLVVDWSRDIPGFSGDHQSTFTIDDLSTFCDKPANRIGRERVLWDKDAFTRIGSWTDFNDYMKDSYSFAQAVRSLYEHGLIFIKNVPEDERAIEQIAQRIGPIRNTLYGLTWDVKSVQDAKNVAYTNHHLGFHMDLLYMADPPGYQLLHTLKNSCEGGESQFADSFNAAIRLRTKDEAAFHTLRNHPVTFAYRNDGYNYEHTHKTIVGPEQGLIERVNWSPPFQGNFDQSSGMMQDQAGRPGAPPPAGKETKVYRSRRRLRAFVAAAQHFSNELESQDMVYEFKMEPGTCAIFENRRIVHARKAFDTGSGERWLKGAYVDEDAFLSTAEGLWSTPEWVRRSETTPEVTPAKGHQERDADDGDSGFKAYITALLHRERQSRVNFSGLKGSQQTLWHARVNGKREDEASSIT